MSQGTLVAPTRLLSPCARPYSACWGINPGRGFLTAMLAAAAAASGRRITLREIRGQSIDRPEILTIPETGYIQGALLQAMD